MKVTIEVDCTPEEARRFMGLPDVSAVQDRMVAEMEEKMREAMNNMDPESLLQQWMPGAMQGFEQMQKAFWNQMGMGGGTADKDKK